MVRHLATIRKIDRITPIQRADKIECAHIAGWPVVIGKDEFHEGDLCVYFEPDSMLPLSMPVFSKLADRGRNEDNSEGELCVVLSTVKLRGQLSQGLVIHLGDVDLPDDVKEGDDVSSILHVEKYDPPETDLPDNMKPKLFFVSTTDEERVQNLEQMVEWLSVHPDLAAKYKASEKIDGTSTSFYRIIDDGEVKYGACSHLNEIIGDEDSDDIYWRNFKAYHAKNLLDSIAERTGAITVVIQGESAGPNISRNRLGLNELRFYAFNVIIDGVRHDPHDMDETAAISVPEINIRLASGIDDVIGQADGMKSLVSPDRLAEGIVWRCDDPDAPSDWSHFKVLNNKYLLKLK